MVPSSTIVVGGVRPVDSGWWGGIGVVLVCGVEGRDVAVSWRDGET